MAGNWVDDMIPSFCHCGQKTKSTANFLWHQRMARYWRDWWKNYRCSFSQDRKAQVTTNQIRTRSKPSHLHRWNLWIFWQLMNQLCVSAGHRVSCCVSWKRWTARFTYSDQIRMVKIQSWWERSWDRAGVAYSTLHSFFVRFVWHVISHGSNYLNCGVAIPRKLSKNLCLDLAGQQWFMGISCPTLHITCSKVIALWLNV